MRTEDGGLGLDEGPREANGDVVVRTFLIADVRGYTRFTRVKDFGPE